MSQDLRSMLVRPPRRPRLSFFLCVLGAWAVLLLLVLVEFFPSYPRTTRGWLVLVVVGPVAYGAAEWASALWSDPAASAQLSPKRFSWRRIFVGVLTALLLIGSAAVLHRVAEM